MENVQNEKMSNIWRPYTVILFAVFLMMVVLAMNTPAYPMISEDLQINDAYIAWMTAFFSMAAAVLAPVMGRFCDIIGMKKIMLLGFGCFAAGCFAMAAAPNYAVMLLGRFAQGLGLASCTPAAMAFAGRFFPPNKVGSAYAIFGGTCTAGPIFGPVLAGFFVQGAGWRAMFVAAGIAVLLGLILVFVFMPNVAVVKQEHKKFDVAGSLTFFIAVGSLLLLPTLASQQGWFSPLSLLFIGLFIVFIVLFGFREKKAEAPIINLKVIGTRTFLVPALQYFVICGIMQAYLYMMSYFMTVGRGQPATVSGLWTTLIFAASTVFAPVAGKLLEHISWKKLSFLPVGFYAAAALLFAMSDVNTPFALLILAGVFMGCGSAVMAPLAMGASLSKVSAADRGSVSGTFRMASDLGGPMGVQVFVPLMSVVAFNESGRPDFGAAFPKVSMFILMVACASVVFSFFYPHNDPQAEAKK